VNQEDNPVGQDSQAEPRGSADATLAANVLEIRLLSLYIAKIALRDLEKGLEAHKTALSGQQYGVLQLLGHHRFTLSELAREMLLKPATLLPVIDALEQNGLVTREQDPTDRRRTPLALTERAHGLMASLPNFLPGDNLLRGMNEMTEEGRQQLVVLLRQLVANIAGQEALPFMCRRHRTHPNPMHRRVDAKDHKRKSKHVKDES
jgi:DNA-binding MarR family transcriptional regulator